MITKLKEDVLTREYVLKYFSAKWLVSGNILRYGTSSEYHINLAKDVREKLYLTERFNSISDIIGTLKSLNLLWRRSFFIQTDSGNHRWKLKLYENRYRIVARKKMIIYCNSFNKKAIDRSNNIQELVELSLLDR